MQEGGDVLAMCQRLEQLLLNDDDNRIQFRSVQGFPALLPHLEAHPCEVLDVLAKACLNEKNIAILREAGPPHSRNKPVRDILALLGAQDPEVHSRASVCVALWAEEGQRTRTVLIEAQAGHAALLFLAGASGNSKTVAHCLRSLKCLAGEVAFRGEMRTRDPPVISVLSKYLTVAIGHGCLEDASGCLALLCNDPALRRQVDCEVMQRCMRLVQSDPPEHVVMNVLGAILNACVDEAPRQHLFEQGAVGPLVALLKNTSSAAVMARTTGILARVAQHSTAAQSMRDQGVVDALVSGVMGLHGGEEFQVAAVRMLAAMATKDPGTVAALPTSPLFKAMPVLLAKLDDTAVGNACMIISQCAAEESNLKKLAKTVEPLVKIMHTAANANRKSVAKNAAIALAKLAKEPKNLEKIRDLHGIEIMFAYIKP